MNKPPPGRRNRRRRLSRLLRRWLGDERGSTALEWVLLLAVIAIPSYVFIRIGLATLLAHYQMITTLNGLPFP